MADFSKGKRDTNLLVSGIPIAVIDKLNGLGDLLPSRRCLELCRGDGRQTQAAMDGGAFAEYGMDIRQTTRNNPPRFTNPFGQTPAAWSIDTSEFSHRGRVHVTNWGDGGTTFGKRCPGD